MKDLKFISNIEDEFLYLFNDNKDELFKDDSAYVKKIREKAINDFKEKGLPDKQTEDYRQIDIRKIFNNDYKKIFNPEVKGVDMNEMFKCTVTDLDTLMMLVVNGKYYDNNEAELPEGIIICDIKEAAIKHKDIFEKHYAKYADTKENAIAALNTAFADNGLFIYFPKNTVLEKAMQIVNILYREEDSMIQQRNLIIAEDNVQAKIVICDHTLNENKYHTNNLTEIYIGKNADLDYYNMQDEHNNSSKVNQVFTNQEKDSRSLLNHITLHGGIVRNNVYVNMNGEGCDNNTLGIYFADKKQIIDNYTLIEHSKPNCTSNELYKGILDENARGSFSGRIKVHKDSQNTQAYQSNNNILITDTAKMFTKPQLEIYADDVVCSHGATVGQIDEEALFYLKTRGISEKESMMMLMVAFAAEVIKKIRIEPLQEQVISLVEKRLRGEQTRCENCNINCG